MPDRDEPMKREDGSIPKPRKDASETDSRPNPENPRIDFHSADFNRVDDLNDCAQNFRIFQSLEGVVTAHERHQGELRGNPGGAEPSPEEPARSGKKKIAAGDPEAPETPAYLTVISEGRTLIIAADADRALICGQALHDQRLPCALILTGNPLPSPGASRSGRMKYLVADRVSVSGAFGGFSAKVTAGGIEKPLSAWFDDGGIFDLVLDLQPVPSFAGSRLPTGYYFPGPGSAALEETIAELPEMRGRFKKPQFVAFHKTRCLHGRSRVRDCRRCLEICPFQAIQEASRGISFNPYLCEGCGGCALVCPAEAIRMAQPSADNLRESLRGSLESRSGDGISSRSLVFSDFTPGARGGPPEADGRGGDQSIFFGVEQIAYLRLEMLLTALASGVREVLVLCDAQNSPAIREAVKSQVQIARAILRGLNLEEDKIRFLAVASEDSGSGKAAPRPADIGKPSNEAPPASASLRPAGDGRAFIYRTAQVLQERAGGRRPWVPLPADSPFGSLAVKPEACTLCMACAAACPSGALSSDGKSPRLVFREFQCHQCGLCRETCPEDAIQLKPRLLLDLGEAEKPAVLRETEPLRCAVCGAPFAPPVMIDRIREKLAGHWMYADERQLRRLTMCRVCRTRDALLSPEMARWKR